MKMKKMKAAMAAMAIVALTFTACSGDDGDTGPAGPAGNANVQGSTYTIEASDWNNGDATISIPGLTKGIAENGQVATYFTLDSLGTDPITWNPMPYRFVANVGGANQFITMQNTVSIGEIVVSARLGNNAGVSFNSESNVRVVLIPSSSLVDGVDVNNYEEVKMVYGIEEYDVK